MTSAEIKAAIERLEKMRDDKSLVSFEVAMGIMDGADFTNRELCDNLIDVFKKANAKCWLNSPAGIDELSRVDDGVLTAMGLMRLPRDAEGEVIHIGDEVCGYGWPDGGVYCRATDGYLILVGTASDAYCDWLLWSPSDCTRAKPKPTIADTLREFLSAAEDAMRKGYDEVPDCVFDEFEGKLREVMDA